MYRVGVHPSAAHEGVIRKLEGSGGKIDFAHPFKSF